MLLACILQVDAVNFNTSENSDRKLSKVIHYKKICQTYWKDRDYGNDKKCSEITGKRKLPIMH